ncbi:MAG: aminodeoxychorismate/anthranilate synthase component II [Armatimonadota bacterium]|nr:aminodeoxychorismate/anthranilate synthase component II [Armatimonadota bacterium]MDR7403554.1 aminodeoxychorismate/anthranilate synthase component II [Armatimonadota bacterium]
MIVVIDNYDSFAYNLVQSLGDLAGEVAVFRNDQTTPGEILSLRPQAVVISPGPCTPAEAGISTAVVTALAGRIPLLGVCLGHQCIGAAFGGRVARAASPVHGKASPVRHDGRTIYAGLPDPLVAGRYHSLVVERDSLPSELEVSAWLEDGTVMGVRHRHALVEGVQFHPESVLTASGRDLLANFLALAGVPLKGRGAGSGEPAAARGG